MHTNERMTELVMYVENGTNLYQVRTEKACDITGAINRIIERLGQYEDTGLSPQEVMTMYKTGGYWKKKYEDVYVCSNCNKTNNSPTTFCPHCGCQMSAPMMLNDYNDNKFIQLNIFEQEENPSLMTSDEVTAKIDVEKVRVAVDEEGNIIDYAMDNTDRVFEVPANWKVHRGHCCVIHGCKYGDDDCPVVEGKIKQSYLCYDCRDPFDFKETDWPDIIRIIKEKRKTL